MKGRIGTKNYNTDTSDKVCNTPRGVLYHKRSRSQEFFLFKSDGATTRERFIDVTWPEANDLVKQYGSREQHIELFTIVGASKTASSTGHRTRVNLDDYHYIKATRNASRLGISVGDYIRRLIDKDDANNNWRH